MPPSHGTWVAVSCDADQSPELMRLRDILGETGDVFYYRAVAWCKKFEHFGMLSDHWGILRRATRFEGSADELRDAFRMSGAVLPDRKDQLFDWVRTNGWILAKQEKDRKRVEARRKAAKVSAKVRRDRARKQRAGQG